MANLKTLLLTFVLGYKLREVIEKLFSFHYRESLEPEVINADEPTKIVGKHWCILNAKNMYDNSRKYFVHFPHAAEVILPCYSYFVENEATNNCGFLLTERRFELKGWIKQLIDAMGCQVAYGSEEKIPEKDIKYAPNMYLYRPRFGQIVYLNHQEHAHSLRRLFVDDSYIESKKGGDHPLQIGIIHRNSMARKIMNLDQIEKALLTALPDSLFHITDLDSFTLKEQATWFATKDVIIGSHGAAMTNSLFITPKTIVMQLYPPGFFFPALEPLIEQAGGIAIQWFEKGPNPYVKFRTLIPGDFTPVCIPEGGFQNERILRSGVIEPPVQDIVDHILYALGRKKLDSETQVSLFGSRTF